MVKLAPPLGSPLPKQAVLLQVADTRVSRSYVFVGWQWMWLVGPVRGSGRHTRLIVLGSWAAESGTLPLTSQSFGDRIRHRRMEANRGWW